MPVAWHPHPDVWLLVALLGGGYAWAVRRVGPKVVHPVERVVSRRQVGAFAAGLASILVVSTWPVHDLGERLFSAHMVEHLVLALVAPPLLLGGTPAWLWRWLLQPVLGAARFVTRPLIALLLFNGVLAALHAPFVVELMLRSEAAHLGLHGLLFGSALVMWAPVLNPLLELPRLSYPARMFYLFLQSLVPTIPASFLTFGDTVIYRFYETVPELWGISAITDQRMAGLLMKIGGGFLIWGFITVYFFKWFALEDREGLDVLEWDKVERDLDRAELDRAEVSETELTGTELTR